MHHETGVSRPKLRVLHRELHGHGAPSGQIPMIGGATIQTRAQQVHAGLFAALYERYAGPAMSRQLDIRAVIAAHDLYGSMVPQEPQLDFNAAWVIARDLRVGTSELRSCGACELRYLVCQRQPAGADLSLLRAAPAPRRTWRAPPGASRGTGRAFGGRGQRRVASASWRGSLAATGRPPARQRAADHASEPGAA